MWKVLLVASTFSKASHEPVDKLTAEGFEVEEYDFGLGKLNEDPEKFCRLIKGVDVLICTAVERVNSRIMDASDRLKMIALRSAGFEGIDLDAATERGILVTNNAGVNANGVAEMAIGLMLAVARKIAWEDARMRQGEFYGIREMGMEISNKTLGIIGLGNIGKIVARRIQGFDMKVIYHDIVEYHEFADRYHIEKVSMDELLQISDIVTLHVPLDDSTRGMIGEKEIQRMKPSAILVNTCRGPVVDEKALYRALSKGHLYGAGLDVHSDEPPTFLDLLQLDNVVSTPHTGGVSYDAVLNMAWETVKKVLEFHDGKIPRDVVNPEVLEKIGLRAG
ncbi:MAG: phosphoglycerate dehydrogenase [Deltaproteobacteria bacterium]|nr:phosphoglycerate dehydrogenase [Deltaproteobacteria bacterium]MBW2307894.1 phosphoglycerate dehydrogenase [Deltaproteobacteria bacterium]